MLQTMGANGRLRAWTAALLALTVLTPASAQTPQRTREIEGVPFARQLEVQETPLSLYGLGLFRYRYFIKAYVAGLYLGDGGSKQTVFEDVPKRLELHYFYGLPRSGFADAAMKILQRNFDATQLEPLQPRIKQMHALYEDVQPGDRYSLTYLPGRGTELALNGKAKGIVPGADFAAAYFAIWLGREPIDKSLRDQLLRES